MTTVERWLFGALAGLFMLGAIFFVGYKTGHDREEAVYNEYKQQQKVEAEQQVNANQKALDQANRDYAQSVSRLQKEHDDETAKLAAARDAAVANSNLYADRLRQYLASAGKQPTGVSGAATGAGGSDKAGGGGLSDGVSDLNRYLVQRFYIADKNASLLNQAIAILAEDRKICNGVLPGVSADVGSPTQ